MRSTRSSRRSDSPRMDAAARTDVTAGSPPSPPPQIVRPAAFGDRDLRKTRIAVRYDRRDIHQARHGLPHGLLPRGSLGGCLTHGRGSVAYYADADPPPPPAGRQARRPWQGRRQEGQVTPAALGAGRLPAGGDDHAKDAEEQKHHREDPGDGLGAGLRRSFPGWKGRSGGDFCRHVGLLSTIANLMRDSRQRSSRIVGSARRSSRPPAG